MGILGAHRVDFADCRSGNRKACQRIIFGYYLFPHLQRMLEKLELVEPPFPPIPRPDPQPWLLHELVPFILAPYLGDPNPQPNLSLDLRLKTTIKFRDGLKELADELDKEIKELEQNKSK